jgi:TRAP-type C4-dicarboxylate transport system permease small subunit
MRVLESLVSRCSAAFRWAAAITVAAMALLITLSVAMRAAAVPLGGEHELVELMMLAVVMLGLAHTQKEKGHIAIGLVVDRLPRRWQAAADGLAALLIAATCLLIGWSNLRVAYDYATASPMSTDFLSIPLYPFKALVGLGFWLWGLQALLGLREPGPAHGTHNMQGDGA